MNNLNVRDKITARIERGDFIAEMLLRLGSHSSDVHNEYVEKLTDVAANFREVLEGEGYIQRVAYEPSEFWPSVRGKTFAFLDGGVANIQLASAAPLGIRVGSYIVTPGDSTETRERFNVEFALVDELYSSEAFVFDDAFSDLMKLRDAARIFVETAAVLKLAKNDFELDAIFLHGPLVNPAAPYGLSDFPAFANTCYTELLGKPADEYEQHDRQFVAAYREILENIIAVKCPAFGVVERTHGSAPGILTRTILQKIQERGHVTERAHSQFLKDLKSYNLSDTALLDVVMAQGELIGPVRVSKQGPENKWPEDWKISIRGYPDAWVTYMKITEDSDPIRVESLIEYPSDSMYYKLLLHTAKLLPNYVFPVGLDIVDKYAKVPNWISGGIRRQHAVLVLKKALQTKDPKAIEFAKKLLAARGRDWFFRPTA